MPTNPEEFACAEGPRPLGKYVANCEQSTRAKETGNAARRTDGKENDTAHKSAQATPARSATPKKPTLKITAAAKRGPFHTLAGKTPVPPKSTQERTNSAKGLVHNISETECSTVGETTHVKIVHSSDTPNGVGLHCEGHQGEPCKATHIHHLGKPGGMIRSGPVRVKTSHKNPTEPAPKLGTRIGIDGTSLTPSKELLRSTACSRGHQVSHPIEDHPAVTVDVGALSIIDQGSEVLDDSIDSSLNAIEMENGFIRQVSHQSEIGGRDFLENPVALTLLNGGTENWQYLVKMDRVHPAVDPNHFSRFESSPGRCGSLVPQESPAHDLMKVSNNLWEVKNEEEVSSIARPKALTASRQISFEA